MFANKNAGVIVDKLIEAIQTHKDYLSEVDGKIGDGDHGVNMNKGFTLCQGELTQKGNYSLSEALYTLSDCLMEGIGGSMGPLYGMFFAGMADVADEHEEIDAETFGKMLGSALREVQEIGSAQRGDKTLLDTLIPAFEAYEAALGAGKDFSQCLAEMDAAAEKGWKSTEDMIAKIGRASRLGERSRGVLDAGATSCYLLLHAMAETAQSLLQKE